MISMGTDVQHIAVLQALEAALPTTVEDMIGLVAAHANAGQQHNFATCQLLQIAASCLVQPLKPTQQQPIQVQPIPD